MTRREIELRCGEISSNTGSKCAFSQDNVLGFIDTSSRLDGSRGIAFFADGLVVNIGGCARGIPYGDICSVIVVESYEDSFADELIISESSSEIRISDYSVDKVKLKQLIDDLCKSGFTDEKDGEFEEEIGAEITDNLAQNNEQFPSRFTEEKSGDFEEENSSEILENSALNNEQFPSGFIEEKGAEFEEEIGAEITDTLAQNNEQFPSGFTEEKSGEFEKENSSEISENSALNNEQFPSGFTEEKSAEFEKENSSEIPDNLAQNNEQISSGFTEEKSAEFEEENSSEISDNLAQNNEQISSGFIEEKGADFEEEISSEFYRENYSKFSADNFSENELLSVRTPEEFILDGKTEFTSVKVLPPTAGETNDFIFETVQDNFDDDFDEQAELEKISAMSREQTMSYLADAFAEINGDNDKKTADNFSDELFEETKSQIQPAAEEKAENALEQSFPMGETLTTEPMWGDIYIKASRSLRELCEQGKLSMDKIREELRERLLTSAEAFVQITADEAKIPKVLMPRITELRSAAKNYNEYFSYGEDIGTRAMFFMLFQMLSYADRIVEDPVAKDRLNDFFRRFGSAGIILSMLDMRV